MSHPPAALAIYLLGPARLERNGQAVKVDTRKAIALLAYLALHPERLSRDQLAAFLWPEYDQERAYANLRRTLWALNKAIGEGWIAADNLTVGLRPQAGLWIDVVAFHRLLAQCHPHGHRRDEVCAVCLAPLAQAVKLVRGAFLEGFSLSDSPAFDDWQFFEAESLRKELAVALEKLVQGHSAQQEDETAIGYARRWLALDPLHEPVHRWLMQLYAWTGQPAAALRQYQECVRIFDAELGVPPEPETTALYEQLRTLGRERGPQRRRDAVTETLLEVDNFDSAAKARSPEQSSLPLHNLPTQLTPFVGRQRELMDLSALLAHSDVHLVTILGPGGIGKTRLALELAVTQLDHFLQGVYFVALAAIATVDAVMSAVADVLHFSFCTGRTPLEQLCDYLRHKQMLLVMDNFEHLVEDTPPRGESQATTVACLLALLGAAPGVKVLATSRSRLNVQGEQLYFIEGIDLPPAAGDASLERTLQTSAVQLFVQSAGRVQAGFRLSPDNLADVVCICRQVQGMPLGILLAAAWAAMLTPAEIAAELSQSLDFLATDLGDLPERQRSLRAVFDHSWRLLTERERVLFQQLSVCRGGFTRAAAQAVASASLHDLMVLVNKSLLQRTPSGRYELHELLRQYAIEILAQSPTAAEVARDRHSAYYTVVLQQWAADLKGPRQQVALAELEADVENAQAAWQWAVERKQIEQVAQAMDGLGRFYDWRGRYQEAAAAYRLAVEQLAPVALQAPPSARALQVFTRLLMWHMYWGGDEQTQQWLHKSRALLDSPICADQDTRAAKADILMGMGYAASNLEEKQQLFEQSLVYYQALGDQAEIAGVLNALGWVALNIGSYAKAHQWLQKSLALSQSLGDNRGIAMALMGLGISAAEQMQMEEAERLMRESFTLLQATGRGFDAADAFNNLGALIFYQGKFAEAHALVEEGAIICSDLGFRRPSIIANNHLSQAKVHLGQYDQAYEQGQRSLTLAQEIGDQELIGVALMVLGEVALAQARYLEAQRLLQGSSTIFRELGFQDLSTTLAVLGIADCSLGMIPQAQQYLSDVLRRATEVQSITTLAFALPALALLLVDQAKKERAVELYALVLSDVPFVANSRWFEDVVGRHIATAAATLPPAVVAAAKARGQARELWTTAKELLVEIERS